MDLLSNWPPRSEAGTNRTKIGHHNIPRHNRPSGLRQILQTGVRNPTNSNSLIVLQIIQNTWGISRTMRWLVFQIDRLHSYLSDLRRNSSSRGTAIAELLDIRTLRMLRKEVERRRLVSRTAKSRGRIRAQAFNPKTPDHCPRVLPPQAKPGSRKTSCRIVTKTLKNLCKL